MHSLIYSFFFCFALAACGTTEGARTNATAQTPPAPPRATDPSGSDSAEASAHVIAPALIARRDIADMPGWESRLYLVEYPLGVKAQLDAPTEQCVGYVLEGRLAAALGKGPVMVARAGEGFAERPQEPRRLMNPDPTRPLRFVLAGTFHKDALAFLPLTSPGPTDLDFSSEQASPDKTRSAAHAAGASEERLTEVTRTLLAQREIADLPGMESRMYLIAFPPGAESKGHVHTVQAIGYVLEGTFASAFGDDPTTVKRAGEGFVDTPGKPHHFRNMDSTRPLRFVIAGTFHKDEPLFRLLEK